MTVVYDKYYQTENLFGEPYPELIAFFNQIPEKGSLLDLGCGQGRDAVALARCGFTVTGVDNSKVGIDQLNKVAKEESLNLTGFVDDIYEFDKLDDFDFVLLDSMFHFAKKDKKKEVELIQKIVSNISHGCIVVICLQDTGNKVQILNQAIDYNGPLKRLAEEKFIYTFEDKENGHRSESEYRMIVVEK